MLFSIDRTTCKTYLQYLKTQKLTNKTIARHIASLRSFWHYLNKHQLVNTNPWALLNLPKATKYLPNIIKAKHLIAFIDAIDGSTPMGTRNKLIVECLYSTGIRVSELTDLTLKQVNLSQQELLIKGKGQTERLVIFGNYLHTGLKTYLAHTRPQLAGPNESAVFINKYGTKLTPRSIQRMLKEESKKQGFAQTITPHVLRHSFATDLFNGGADIRSVQELLGHKNVVTTQIYTHLSEELLTETFTKAHPRAKKQPPTTPS